MTIWTPSLTPDDAPIYRSIADAISRSIDEGELAPSDRLPTHRALARQLDVTVGTVSRAYAEAERRGLVVGEVGRGTFIRGPRPGSWAGSIEEEEADEALIDMSLNFPGTSPEEGRILSETLRALACESDLAQLLGYQRYSGSARQREAGALWINRRGLEADRSRVLVCAGAQHTLNVIFSTLTRPGDTILAEALTYPGMKSLAQMLHLRLRGLPMDEFGLIPEALDRACATDDVRALYCIPTIQNPTASIMPEERRREIAEIARERDILMVEDDVHAFLPEEMPPTIASFAPERTCYILSTGKSVAPSLRISYLLSPESLVERLDAGVRTTTWMASPLTAEIAAMWIDSGTVDEILALKRAVIKERHEILDEVLGAYEYDTHPSALHVWFRLPEPWRSADFVAQARQRGVLVTGAEAFAVGREEIPHAVRICLGAPPTSDALCRGLSILAEILGGRAEPCMALV